MLTVDLAKEAKKLYVAEYSKIQGCYHIGTLDEAITKNSYGVLHNNDLDFIPFGIFETYTEAKHACNSMRNMRRDKGWL